MVVATAKSREGFRRVIQRPVGVFSAHFAVIPTAWGMAGVVWKNHEGEQTSGFAEQPEGVLAKIYTPGLSGVELHRQVMRSYSGCREVLGDGRGNFHPEVVPGWFPDFVRFMQGYYSAVLRHEREPEVVSHWAIWRTRLDWSQLTPFQRQVLEVVAAIPSGRQMTYGAVAARIGKPAASRAVGAAIGNNPWPVLVPCHRVIGASGKLTGFSAPGGIETKRKMLAMEARSF